ncbi:MAG: S9 family peptidase [Herpetosiphonaceae bacterium]|nr:S9 family peptidase [Herpetosiphonaceae bacterium]
MAYPVSPRCHDVEVLHGHQVPDPYRWLEEIDSEETQRWSGAQNALTSRYLAAIPERESLRARLTQLWNYEKYGVPFQRGDRYFFTRNDGLQNQSVLYWMDALDGQPQVVLDPNELSTEGTVALTAFDVSDDGQLLAYALSASGSDWQTWQVRDVASGRDLSDHLQWSKFSSAVWTNDGTGFYYCRYDAPAEGMASKETNYYHKVFFHRIGTEQAADSLVYERPDQKDWLFDTAHSDDGHYLILYVSKGTQVENGVFFQDLQSEDGTVVELLKDFDASYRFIGNDGPLFYFMTDCGAPLSRVIAIDIERPDPSYWREVIPETADTLQDVHLVHDRFIAAYLHDAHSRIQLFTSSGTFLRTVELPGMGTVQGFGGRREDHESFYMFTSFTTPGVVYHYDLATNVNTIFREPRLSFDPSAYTTEQFFVPSNDGTGVPVFLSYRRGLTRTSTTPTYLYGYGGFNIALTPTFSVANLVWMERGGLFVQANLRGGGEYGTTWHEAGMKATKQNVFDDFIAVAEWLIREGYTSAAKLAIGGGSNGGLLVGACLTQRPELFGACIVAVGVLDMLRFHRFTIGWAWVSDYGSPDDPEEFTALLAYSPYHNLRPDIAYPATLITTGDHDDRVFPAHSFKFAAALQAAQGGAAPILIRIDSRAGHGAGKPTAKLIVEWADCWAFLVRILEFAGTGVVSW